MGPPIQVPLVQIDIGHEWRAYCPLGCTDVRTDEQLSLHQTSFEKAVNQVQESTVSYSLCPQGEQSGLRHAIEEALDSSLSQGALPSVLAVKGEGADRTTSQDTLPELGKQVASKANRDGVAERCAAHAVHKSIAVDLALSGHDDHRPRDMELCILNTAQEKHTNTLSLLRTVPEIGEILSLVLLYEMHAIDLFPRVQDCVSDCRLVKCSKASAGKR